MLDILPARTNPHRSGVNQSLGRPRPVETDAHSFSLGQGMMLAGIDPTARGHAGAAPTGTMGSGTVG